MHLIPLHGGRSHSAVSVGEAGTHLLDEVDVDTHTQLRVAGLA